MYNNSEIAQKIKDITKKKGISLKHLLDDCNLNINYISEFSKGKDITGNNLFIIAEYLDVSIDYLLGRTDQPNGYYNKQVNSNNSNSYIIGDNNNNTGNEVNNNSLNGLDKNMQEIVDSMKDFSILEQAEIITKINEIKSRR